MRKPLLVSLALLSIPAAAFALNYSDTVEQYNDASSFTMSERAAINVLTHLGAVEGNPDGTFRARRTLNRAEFLKIALLSADPTFEADADWCFPDVHKEDWFSTYVCYAKEVGIVKGYPDGLFHPEREVNYVEALKMLVERYGYELPRSGTEWYTTYLDAAGMHDVLFTPEPRLADFLTRGQMARLAAAFAAEAEGELDDYRAAERGEWVSSSSSESSASSVSSSSESSESSASSASSLSPSSSSATAFMLPAVNRLTLLDRVSPPLADATFTQTQEMIIREVRVTLTKKIKSMSDMYLTDENGNILGTLRLDSTDSTDEKWYAIFDAATGTHIPANKATSFGITGKLRPWGTGGVSGEMIQLERLSMILQTLDATSSTEALPSNTHFPKVQTTQTILSKIINGGETAGTLQAGANKIVGAFIFSGSLLPGTSILDLQQLQFTVTAAGAGITSPKIGIKGDTAGNSCGYANGLVTCTSLPTNARDASHGITLELRADVTRMGDGVHTLQISLNDPGTTERAGAVQWFDGTTPFAWLDFAQPIAAGTHWTVVNP